MAKNEPLQKWEILEIFWRHTTKKTPAHVLDVVDKRWFECSLALFEISTQNFPHLSLASGPVDNEFRSQLHGTVYFMHPVWHLKSIHRRPVPCRSAPPTASSSEHLGPYGHGLAGSNRPPIVFTHPSEYQVPLTKKPAGAADKALRESDAKLLAQLAQSKSHQESRENAARERAAKRKAAVDENEKTEVKRWECLARIRAIDHA
ncbi:hypothetical protein DFH07DRAFT_765196 [Mycena maculata]|uniref:Uncharacterized protein n=1 Tax=Mycena maculata TaxID=230809 RepID=A0AAD7K8P5_9AGAR|nr:hypothetical protein DFH07DRAFT_765196 [Mycena maculata]